MARPEIPDVNDTDFFDDLADSGYAKEATNPDLKWATNDQNFDISMIKPHKCMSDVVQRGNFIHCNTGNHGMRIPVGKILIKDERGNFDLVDVKDYRPKLRKIGKRRPVAQG